MLNHKKNLPFVLFTCLLLGCGAANNKAKTPGGITPKNQQAPVQVPPKILTNERTIWRATLLTLEDAHPDRVSLRNRLVQSIAAEFAATPETERATRADLFREALALHAAIDWKRGTLSPELETMANWLLPVFEKRGNEAVVLACLKILMLLHPEDKGTQARYKELVAWSESIRQTIENPMERTSSLISLYLETVQMVPEIAQVEQLAKLYIARHDIALDAFSGANLKGNSNDILPYQLLFQGRVVQTIPIDLIYVFFLAGEPGLARRYFEQLPPDDEQNGDYLKLLSHIDEGKDLAEVYFTLSTLFKPIDPNASLRAAFLARASTRQDPRMPLYIATLFDDMEQPECAFDFLNEASALTEEPEILVPVVEMYKQSLLKVHMADKGVRIDDIILRGDQLVARLEPLAQNSNSDLGIALTSLLFTIGDIEFDLGHVDNAKRHLEASFKKTANIRSLVKLADLYILLGEHQKGLDLFDQSLGQVSKEMIPTGYWQAILMETRGDLLTGLYATDKAKAFYVQALAAWNQKGIPEDQLSFSEIRKGVVFDKVGDSAKSAEAFRTAIRANPNQSSIYAQVISYLVGKNRLADAKEFYRLAANQDNIDVIWKIYFSLWIEALSQRQEGKSFDMSRRFLELSKGTTWQDRLAQYYTGNLTTEALRQSATTPGELMETDFYASLMAMSKNDWVTAKAKLEQVAQTKLLGFFEYRMAVDLLKNQQIQAISPTK